MKVEPIGFTTFLAGDAQDASGYQPHSWRIDGIGNTTDADELAEMAGRACYQSWSRPNPKTATNQGYLENILNQGHESVLEHASISFYVTGVSRSLLTELSRHRHLSFSVVSQRYVKQDRSAAVVPPALRDHGDALDRVGFHASVDLAFKVYEELVESLVVAGLPRKKAYEAARSVLPNATEVKMVVTGNVRAWRDVLRKRYHEAADAEILEFATEVLRHLRDYAPNSVQDFPEEPFS